MKTRKGRPRPVLGCSATDDDKDFILRFHLLYYIVCLFQNHACAKKDESINISQYKDKFRLAAGQYTGTIKFECDSGNSCFKFDAEFKKGK
jgi:hypothetical protein